MRAADILKVNLGTRSYNIVIGEQILPTISQHLPVRKGSRYIIVSDSNIPQDYSSQLATALSSAGARVEQIIITPGEESKSFTGLEQLLDRIFAFAPDRHTVLVALGGGVIGDLTGFAASILLRGVDFIQVPTTLLAQVDSSVGGKTGINNRFGKNLVGSFYQPRLVLADTSTLESLPRREFLAGYAEVVKYGLINDAAFFQWLENNLRSVLAGEPEALRYIISTSCKAKADIVSQDERESGARALLNLGHTLGHALEQQMGYDGQLVHGEAVSIGMVFAFMVSQVLGHCPASDVERVKAHLAQAGLPVSPLEIIGSWDVDALMQAMRQDKKVQDGKMVFVLAKGIGQSFVEKGIDEAVICDTIEMFLTKR